MALGARDEVELSSFDNGSVHLVGESQDAQAEKTGDEQYPHGLKLVLLASASIVAVFLIALDQVRYIPK